MLFIERISVESKIQSFHLILTFLFEENIMSKTIIHTDKAPAAIGAYSQAVRAGDTVYMSGQIPLDPATMTVVGDGDFRAEAVQVFKKPASCSRSGRRFFERYRQTQCLFD